MEFNNLIFKKPKYWLLFFIIQLCFSINVILSQTSRNVEGRVIDSFGIGIEMAVVCANSSTDNNFICFTNSDEKGEFSLSIPSNISKFNININRLGYKPFKHSVTLDSVHTNTLCVLSPQLDSIKEVVVIANRSRIVESGDTTTYFLKDFRDSTEYSIEDLLKKLPGIEVSSDGKIKANGKDIKTVLVEGSDMFGRQYTIGTKNIRAIAIDQVDIINRYEDNPVLKGIRQSDDVVLNVKLNPNKINIVNGNSDVGIGIGSDALKGSCHINVFNITRKIKNVLLSDNGNATQTLNTRELMATYDDLFAEDDNKSPIRSNTELTLPPNIINPGVLKDFIDNSLNSFSTIRNIFNPTERLKVGINAIFAHNRDKQESNQYQSYLYDSGRYTVDILQQLQTKKRVFEIEGNIYYTTLNQKTSFQLVSKYYGLNNDVIQTTDNKQQLLQNVFLNNNSTLSVNGIFSNRISTNSLLQVQIKTQSSQSREIGVFQNQNFNIISLSDTLLQLNQLVENPYTGILVNGRYVKKYEKLILQLETEWIKADNILNHKEQYTRISDEIINHLQSYNQRISLNTFNNRILLKYFLKPLITIKINMEQTNKSINSNNFLRDNYKVSAPKANIVFEVDKQSFGRISTGYNWSQNIPDENTFFSNVYFKDAFNRYTSSIRDKNNLKQNIFFNYSYKNTFKNQFFNLNVILGFKQNLWRESFIFKSSIQEISPFYSEGNQTFNVNSNFSKFISSIKTSVEVKAGYSNSKALYDFQNVETPISVTSYKLNPTLRIALKYFLRLNISNDFNFIKSQNKISQSTNNFINNNFSSELFYNLDKWRFSLSLNNTTSINNSNNASSLFTSNFSFARNIIFKKKESTLRLQVYNLNFIKTYDNIFNDDIIFFKYSVEAIKPFFILKYDFSF